MHRSGCVLNLSALNLVSRSLQVAVPLVPRFGAIAAVEKKTKSVKYFQKNSGPGTGILLDHSKFRARERNFFRQLISQL